MLPEIYPRERPNNPNQLPNDTTLYLGDLSAFTDERMLISVFKPFGNIASVRVQRSSDGSNKPLCYGFIQFYDSASAAAALDELNGKFLEGRAMRIRWATSERDDQAQSTPRSRVQVLVSFVSHPTDGEPQLVTERHLRDLLLMFGEVTDCVVKKSSMDLLGRQSGYGFVHFAESEDGVRAALQSIDRVKRFSVGAAIYDCRLSDSLHNYMQQQQHRQQQQQQQFRGTAIPDSYIRFDCRSAPINYGGGSNISAHASNSISMPASFTASGANHNRQQQYPPTQYYNAASAPPQTVIQPARPLNKDYLFAERFYQNKTLGMQQGTPFTTPSTTCSTDTSSEIDNRYQVSFHNDEDRAPMKEWEQLAHMQHHLQYAQQKNRELRELAYQNAHQLQQQRPQYQQQYQKDIQQHQHTYQQQQLQYPLDMDQLKNQPKQLQQISSTATASRLLSYNLPPPQPLNSSNGNLNLSFSLPAQGPQTWQSPPPAAAESVAAVTRQGAEDQAMLSKLHADLTNDKVFL